MALRMPKPSRYATRDPLRRVSLNRTVLLSKAPAPQKHGLCVGQNSFRRGPGMEGTLEEENNVSLSRSRPLLLKTEPRINTAASAQMWAAGKSVVNNFI